MKRLRSQEGVGARALEFGLDGRTIREVRGAIWSEVDLKSALRTDGKLKQSVTRLGADRTLRNPVGPCWTFDVVFDLAEGTTNTREPAARCAHAHTLEQTERRPARSRR